MKKAIMIGAGNIGRGFIGMLLEKSGYHVVFADVNMAVVDDINKRKEYTVHLVDTVSVDTTCTNISAISSLSEQMITEIADPDTELICTSVGLTALSKVAPAIAKGLSLRSSKEITGYLNIIACENAIRGTSQLKKFICEYLDTTSIDYIDKYVGFPDAAVDRIIPPNKTNLPAEVYVERYHEWDVEKCGFKGILPVVEGMEIVDDLTAYLERKLFTLNGPNAVTAYYAYLKGIETINEAMEDKEIFNVVYGMMVECGEVLVKRHGFTPESMLSYRTSLVERFKNPYVVDDAIRVAREPKRKLSPDDRIIAPMLHATEYGIQTPHYYTGVAVALLYNNEDDTQSIEIQNLIKDFGVRKCLEIISNVPIDSTASIEIEKEYIRLKSKYHL